VTILLTGAAGFIGFHVAQALLAQGRTVLGVDIVNDYYDPALKHARLKQFEGRNGFHFVQADIADRDAIFALLDKYTDITAIIHLAAQAGVRYSLKNPFAYVQSNLMGQVVMLEAARALPGVPLVYASSSSVYGGNTKLPFAIEDSVDRPVSLYAATKRADELMSHTYSHLYGIPATGLRFFTVYGPWGRPDMAYYSFAKAILEGKPIPVFNHGKMKRDFTYIDDIVSGVIAAMERPPVPDEGGARHRVYNLGNHKAENLMDFIAVLEEALGRKAEIDFQPMQPGDVEATYADIAATTRDLGFAPTTPITVGLPKFVAWYKQYHQVP
jgi:UDP-glucuronate 4-epimerase